MPYMYTICIHAASLTTIISMYFDLQKLHTSTCWIGFQLSIMKHQPTSLANQVNQSKFILLVADGKHEIRCESHLQGFQIETMQQEEIVK